MGVSKGDWWLARRLENGVSRGGCDCLDCRVLVVRTFAGGEVKLMKSSSVDACAIAKSLLAGGELVDTLRERGKERSIRGDDGCSVAGWFTCCWERLVVGRCWLGDTSREGGEERSMRGETVKPASVATDWLNCEVSL